MPPEGSERSDHDEVTQPSRIIFGSCNSQHFEQPFWDVIAKRNPAAFVWAGDAIYADDRPLVDGEHEEKDEYKDENSASTNKESGRKDDTSSIANGKRWLQRLFRHRHGHRDATPDYLRQLYRAQKSVPGYQALLARPQPKISIFGTIDDHDYGRNNGDRTFPWRRESGIEFIRFLGLDEESSAMARRAARGLGVYGVHVYDFSNGTHRLLSDEEAGLDPDVGDFVVRNDETAQHEGKSDTRNRLVAVFVIDVRTNKTPWRKSFPQRFSADPHGDFLGEEQWTWLESALGRSRAAVNILVSGIQVHAPWFYDGNLVENWSGFPAAQHRLYQTILQSNVRAPILLSGDVHLAQLLRKDCHRQEKRSNPSTSDSDGNNDDGSEDSGPSLSVTRPLYEVTTSGMTHSWGSTKTSVCGRPGDHWLCTFYPYNTFMGMILDFAHRVNPWTALILENQDSPNNLFRQPQFSLDRNIAELEFNWVLEVVSVRIMGDEGQVLLRQEWSMDRLTGSNATTMLHPRSFQDAQGRLVRTLLVNQSSTVSNHSVNLDSNFVCVNYRGNPGRVHVAMGIFTTVFVFLLSATSPFLLSYVILAKLVFPLTRPNGIRPRKKIKDI